MGKSKYWYEQYASMYPDACQLGISYDNYWEMQPIEVYGIALAVQEAKKQEFVNKLNNELAVAWYGASLQGIAMNDPKKFPKKPPKYETEQEKQKQKLDNSLLLAVKLEAMMHSGQFNK